MLPPLDLASFAAYFEKRGPLLQAPQDAGWAFLDGLAAQASDHAGLQRYANACPTANPAEDYAPRLLQLNDECSVIAGIHFRGLETRFPFVDVSAATGPLPASLDGVFAPFSAFAPKAARIWRVPGDPMPRTGRDDMLVVAGNLDALRAAPPLGYAARVQLQPDPTLQSYPEYRMVYDALTTADRCAVRISPPEQLESLAECARAGAYFRVLVDQTPVGFIAARPEAYRMWSGWFMVEEVLHPMYRGHGLAPSIQQAFLHSLDSQRGSLVLGTIDARNTPSLKTALRVGRRVVEQATFVFPNAETFAAEATRFDVS